MQISIPEPCINGVMPPKAQPIYGQGHNIRPGLGLWSPLTITNWDLKKNFINRFISFNSFDFTVKFIYFTVKFIY